MCSDRGAAGNRGPTMGSDTASIPTAADVMRQDLEARGEFKASVHGVLPIFPPPPSPPAPCSEPVPLPPEHLVRKVSKPPVAPTRKGGRPVRGLTPPPPDAAIPQRSTAPPDTAEDMLTGSGVDGGPECFLIGTEDLPMMGAAGVLVLPKRPGPSDGGTSRGSEDDLIQFASEELSGWGGADNPDPPGALLDAALQEKHFTAYTAGCIGSGGTSAGGDWVDLASLEQLQEFAAENSAPNGTPSQGPSLVQLAHDARRREECPVCNSEWIRAVKTIRPEDGAANSAVPVPLAAEAASSFAGGRRRSTGGGGGRALPGKVKMHSTRCCWMWYQQNLCQTLGALRFDAQGEPRHICPNPNKILPPPIMDAWGHWKPQKPERSNRKGEPP